MKREVPLHEKKSFSHAVLDFLEVKDVTEEAG
jgi:hypothetical protein